VLEQVRPSGIILFSRNIDTPEQASDLVDSLNELDPRPFVCVDLEGGAVNRLAALWGTLPSPSRAAAAGRRAIRALGEATGAACRCLGIHLNLAPVIDLEHPEGLIARQSRTLSEDPERVATLARVFAEGLAAWCVSGCLKHFPGIGAATLDTHLELPVVELDAADMERHLGVFAALSDTIPIVMVGHVVVPSLGDPERPASLSPTIVDRAASLPGSPVVLSDDLEMDALAAWGDLPERVVAALSARSHGALVCKAFDQLELIRDTLDHAVTSDPGFATRVRATTARLGTLRRDLCRTTASVPAPDAATVEQLWERARREAEP
jgi:beta-N-acetylhexosaminidase